MRIFVKEARTLARAGHDVHVMAPGDAPASQHDVTLHRLPGFELDPRVLPWHVWPALPAMYRAARALRADAYHLTDPLLVPLGLMLQRDGARIVYHAARAGDRGSVVRYGPTAARAASAAGAHRQSSGIYRLLMHGADEEFEPAQRAEFLEQAAIECYLIGDEDRCSAGHLREAV